ncbi:MAG: MFS transporter [Anaerolineae bacterium]
MSNPSPLPSFFGSRKVTIGLYVAAAFFYWLSLYWYVPTLPTYVQSKSDNLAMVGTVLSMYGLWQALVRLPLGIAADWLGRRKPFILGGLLLAGLGAWLMGIADGATGLLVGRSITGLAAAAWVPLLVAFSGLFPLEEAVRATSMLTFVNSSGRILATGSTGVLNNWGGYSLPFFLAAGAALLGFLVLLPAREIPRARKRPSVRGITRLVLRQDVLLPALLAALSQYANWGTTFGFNPILARQFGGSDITQSMLVTMHIGVVIVGNLGATALVNRLGARRLVTAGFVLMALGVALGGVANGLWLLFAAQFAIGIAQGISYPVLMGLSIRYVDDSERNTAMGLHQSVYAIGMFAGPWLSGVLAEAIGIQPMFLLTAAGTLLLGLVGSLRLAGRPDRPA